MNQSLAAEEMEWGGNPIAHIRYAPQRRELRQGIEALQHDMSEHAVKTIDKVQAQENMIRIELKKSLDSVNNGFNPSGRPNPKLEGGEQAGESAGREKAQGREMRKRARKPPRRRSAGRRHPSSWQG